MSKIYQELNIKLILLGAGGVGKTSLCNAILHQDVPDKYIPTIGSSISRKEYQLKNDDLNTIVNLWDIGGQREFSPLNPAFFKNADVVLLTFDVSKPEKTINDLRVNYLEPLLSQVNECVILLVGNKIDLNFNKEKVKQLINKEHLGDFPILFTSALESINVDDIIEYAVYSYFNENEMELRDDGLNISFKDFLRSINRSEEVITSIPVNIDKIGSAKIRTTSPIKIKEKREELEEIIENKKYQFLRERFGELEAIQNDVRENFVKNMSFIEESITNLRKIPIRFLIEEINGILSQLEAFKEDFQEKLDISNKINEISKEELKGKN